MATILNKAHFRPKGGGKRGSTGPPAYFIPEDLYAAFELKPGIPFWRPRTSGICKPKTHLGGLASFLTEHRGGKQEAEVVIPEKKLEKVEDRENRMIKYRWQMRELAKAKAQAEYALNTQRRLLAWDPYAPNDAVTPDPYLTLFVARLDEKVTEPLLKDFMKAQSGGEVTHIRIVRDLKHPKRCYAFVQFDTEKALQKAFHSADGVLFMGRNILVDVERGRTVRAWVPRKFGGGLGGAPRQKGFTIRKGRGAPEPPPMESRKRRADRPLRNDRPPHPRTQY